MKSTEQLTSAYSQVTTTPATTLRWKSLE